MNKLITIGLSIIVSLNICLVKHELSFSDTTLENRSEIAGMTEDEFLFISSVVEAESDRRVVESEEDLEGRIYIAVCILNRVNDSRFPDTITEVLNQRGQFSTVRNGRSVTNRTDASDLAVIRAVEWSEEEDYPEDILFFNCVGYSYGEPYGYIGGNYFMTLED